MPGKVTPVVGYRMPGAAITMPVVRTGTQTPEISTGGGTVGTADWATRSAGVVRARRLADPSELGNSGYQNYVGYEAGDCAPFASPVIQNGYLSFSRPSQAASNPSGWWWMNFSDDGSVQFDVGDTFYVQLQTWWSQGWFNQIYLQGDGVTPQNGIKFFDLVAGHQSGIYTTSDVDLKMVFQSYIELRAPHVYGYDAYGANTAFLTLPDYGLQNQFPACKDGLRPGYGTNSDLTPSECFCPVPETWMVWKVRIDLLDRVIMRGQFSCFDFRMRLWGAVLGQPSTLVMDWQPSTSGYFPLQACNHTTLAPLSFSKIVCFPYLTGQSATQVTTAAEARYREIIVSRNDIADPAVTPTWLVNIPLDNAFHAIPNTSLSASGLTSATIKPDVITPWSSFAWTPTGEAISCCNGGHTDSGDNGVYGIDFSHHSPAWARRLACSASVPPVSWNSNNGAAYYPDGRPASRHVYNNVAYIAARNIVYLPFAAAVWSGNAPCYPDGQAFHLDTNTFDADGTGWPDAPLTNANSLTVKHPTTEDIYCCSNNSGNGWFKWTQASGQYGAWSQIYPAGNPIWIGLGCPPTLIDDTHGRNHLVTLLGDGKLSRINLNDLSVDYIALSGTAIPADGTGAYYAGVVHDLDQDRYILIACSGAVYSINPTSGAVGVLTSTLAAPGYPANSDGVFMRCAYIQLLGGIFYCPTFTDDWQFMRTR